ncbi:MAG: (d)CMP kinase [Oscillospiraceae bacterium]|nr:(d)CMP kinase [Oscillospiraceae bacterium]
MKLVSVAIDGPVGAGKSTIARTAAKRLGFVYCDTGALYRAVGLYCLRSGTDMGDSSAIAARLPEITVEIRLVDGVQRVFLNGSDVSEEIRLPEVSMAASTVSAVPEVRAALLDLQRGIAEKNNVIMDGRDIGTVVLPNADVKIFLTAKPEIRAKRRYDELVSKGMEVVFEDVLEDLQKRDYNDSHRAAAPLKQAEDAVLADTSELDFEQSVELVCGIIQNQNSNKT